MVEWILKLPLEFYLVSVLFQVELFFKICFNAQTKKMKKCTLLAHKTQIFGKYHNSVTNYASTYDKVCETVPLFPKHTHTHTTSLFFCHRNKECEWFVGETQMKLVDLSCKTLMQEIPMKMSLYDGIVTP